MLEPTPEQAAAIASTAPRRVIIAHPGTGKTFTLVEIIADYLRSRGRSADCVTAISFTRAAARELRERVTDRVGVAARDVTFGTSHALALDIIRSGHRHLGLPKAITVYDEQDQRDVVAGIIETLGYSSLSIKRALEAIDGWRSGVPGEYDAKAVRVAREYETRLRAAGALDIDLMIPGALRVLREDDELASLWSRRARYLIVDEYQDTAPTEVKLYEALRPRECVIVGDPNQEIYRFRGTSNRHLLAAAEHEDTEAFVLSQSFRSGAAVVDAANRLIAHNGGQPEEPLRANPAAGSGDVIAQHSETFEAQDDHLVGIAKHLLTRGSVGLLSRTNRELAHAIRSLEHADVPVFALSLPRAFYGLDEVRTFHAALRCAHNPGDLVATRRLLGRWPGLPAHGSQEWFDARLEANRSDVPVLEHLGWDVLQRSWSLSDLAEEASHVLAEGYAAEGRTSRGENVQLALQRLIAWSLEHEAATTLEDFVDWLQMRELADAPRDGSDEGAVHCGTIHSAKGLEWDSVIVVGCREGHFPSSRADLEEERRLAYVAMTRARLHVRLLWCSETGKKQSRFVAESLG